MVFTENGEQTVAIAGQRTPRESDLAMGPFFPASERLEIARPSTVFYMEELRILAGRKTAQDSSVFGYIMAFDWMVWMFLSVALVIVSVVTALLNHVQAYMSQKTTDFVRSIGDATWMYVENLFLEATAEPPQRGGQRILSAVWWLATLVLMNAFCGHMRACLMIKSEVEKIESAEDLIRRPHTNSTNPALRKLGRIVEDRATAVPVPELYGRALLEKVAQGRAAIISDATSLTFQVSSKCQDFVGAEYYLAREGLVSHPLNSFARKDINPELFDNINKVIRRLLEAGLVNYWWGLAMGEIGRCGGSSSSSGAEQASTLTFDDLMGVFVLWLACVTASSLAFLAETSVPGMMNRTTPKVAATGWRRRQIRLLPRSRRVS
ncbi:glutamate receptor 2-like [Dermacentor albipictus]|uniref:glutamate receptor 2-like n=1 Tax=Dermacentor albipictus TaxID=60249 RepID=UPI0031FBB966